MAVNNYIKVSVGYLYLFRSRIPGLSRAQTIRVDVQVLMCNTYIHLRASIMGMGKIRVLVTLPVLVQK